MTIGVIALIFAFAAAAWLLLRLARDGIGEGGRTMTVLKLVVWLGLAAALFAAKLWPLAFMVLLAAGGVTAIEAWRGKKIDESQAKNLPPAVAAGPMSRKEAAAILGVSEDAGPDEISGAYKKLISQIHPDKGGTNYLAAKINEARDLLMREVEKPAP